MFIRFVFSLFAIFMLFGCSSTLRLGRAGWDSKVNDSVLDFAFSLAESSRVYALVSRSGPRFLVASNDGFASVTDIASFNDGWVLEVHPSKPDWIYLGGKSLLWSRDAGKTWIAASTNLSTGYGLQDLLIPPQDRGRIYALTRHPIRVYDAACDTLDWRLRTEIKGSGTYGVGIVCARQVGRQPVLYVACYDEDNGHVLRSDNNATTWQKVGRGLPEIQGLAIDESAPDEPYVVANGELLRFVPTDGSWKVISEIPASISIRGRLGIDPRTGIMFISTDGRFGAPPGPEILRSTDGGRSWQGG